MDDADKTAEHEEITTREAIRSSRKAEGPIATGRCPWCDEVVGDGVRWCPDEECRDQWEKQRRFKR